MAINLKLDLNKRPNTGPINFIRVGDANIDSIEGTIVKDGVAFDLTGYSMAFEGISSDGSSVTDAHVTITNATTGQFKYTFSGSVANAGGRYKNAYFSLTKGGDRTTTGNLDLFVYKDISGDVSDVSQEQIDTYNDLVQKLMDLNDANMGKLSSDVKAFGDKIAAYISGTDADFKDYDAQVAKLISDTQAKIATIEFYKFVEEGAS
ncbi:phage baseplate upper protein [Levilactobacillus humaensis]|uniref:phage baseplate upper protein n=1 Tax=Levilactobacillus humaensis TaxID=2950375 RepID=UPI0021C28300|nr:phage baseplate upper protein [Levilactobacillus humaensis]